MKILTVISFAVVLSSIWAISKMRRTEWYRYSSGEVAAPCGPIIVRLSPMGHGTEDGFLGHTIRGAPYELKIWCGRDYKIDAVKDLVLKAVDSKGKDLRPSVEEAQFTGSHPTPWYFCLKERLDLKYEDYTVAFALTVENKAGNQAEQRVSVTLDRQYSSGWSNDFWDGLMSE
jgi:hypothetical protein